MFLSYFLIAAFFTIGLIIGSFLNCLIYRLNIKQSFMKGRSYCPKCKHQLSWKDLVPVLSYLELNGKCRYCGQAISPQYPLVELAAGILFAAAGAILEPGIVYSFDFTSFNFFELAYYWFVISSLIVVFVYDLKWFLIPDEIVFSGLLVSALFYAIRFFYVYFLAGQADFSLLVNPVLSGILCFSFFLAIFLVSAGRWMGFGDVKFAAFMGLTLGFPDSAVALFFAFFLGAIIGLALIAAKKKEISSEIPFGPFLVMGSLIALFFSETLLYWYLAI